jgi:hypothetical protein
MQSYVLNLAANGVRAFDVLADLFVYESGLPTPTTGDTRIKIKPNTGAEIVLRPGQRFRLAPDSNATHWEVSALDPSVALVGYVIIGSGEFDDANTLNKVTLDASGINNVYINNTPAQRVPVSLDTTQTLNQSGIILSYTNHVEMGSVAVAAGSTTQLISGASNANGMIVNRWLIDGGPAGGVVSLAGKNAPGMATAYDGALLDLWTSAAANRQKSDLSQGMLKIPPGWGLWLWSTNAGTFQSINVLYTLL